MTLSSRVQSNGRITIPTSFRKSMGIRKGDWLAVFETEKGILLKRVESAAKKLPDDRTTQQSNQPEENNSSTAPGGVPLRGTFPAAD